MSFEPKNMFPESTLVWPIMRLKRVVFPEPLGPTKPSISPGETSRFIFFKTGLPLKDLLTLLICRAGRFFLNLIILNFFFI